MNRDMVEEVATRSGLPVLICRGLLNNGWTYVEEIYKPPRWEKRDWPL